MRCKKCNSTDVKDWPFNLYGIRGYMIHCVHCGREYFRSNNQMAMDLKEETNITHNIRVDKNRSNRAVYKAWDHTEWPLSDPNKEYVPVQDFGMAMVNRKREKRK